MKSGSVHMFVAGLLLFDLAIVSGFLSSHPHATRALSLLTRKSNVANETAAAAAPLPLKLVPVSLDKDHGARRRRGDGRNVIPPNKRRRRRRKKEDGNAAWSGEGIPENVPKLSDLMKDFSDEDFKIAVSTDESSSTPSKSPASNVSPRRYPNAKQQTVPRPIMASKESLEPWRATYAVSTRTQDRIKRAASYDTSARKNAPHRATAILKALLDTPPEQCNEVNVVCALTLSAKAATNMTPSTDKSLFRSLLMKTFDILMQLVLEERLNARQLCNAVWAIAKHYNLDNSILPALPEAVPSDEMVGVSEAWILQDLEDSAEQRVKDTVDLIAMQLTRILQKEQFPSKRRIKVGEICMATWAYGVLRPRRRPPGWSVPPQIGHVPRRSSRHPNTGSNVEVVKFSTWAYDDGKGEGMDTPADAIDRLFDAVGDALIAEVTTHDIDDPWQLLQSCTWSEMANVAWAYAHHGYCRSRQAEGVLQGIAAEASDRLALSAADGRATLVLPRDIAQLVWSIGTLQSDNFRLGDDLVHLVDAVADHYGFHEDSDETEYGSHRPLEQWSCPDLVQLAISLAHGRINHLPLLRAIYKEAYQRLTPSSRERFSPRDHRKSFFAWEVSVLLWAQARLYLRKSEGEVFEDFAVEAPSWILNTLGKKASLESIGIGPQEQANLAWSLTVLERHVSADAGALLERIFHEASSSSEKRHSIQLEHAHQLWQALYLIDEERPSLLERVPRWFSDFLEEKWNAEKARRKMSSARHRSLSQTLNLMGVAHYNEHDEDIDVAIVLKDDSSWTHKASRSDHNGARHKVAVEFDGPNHFTREQYDKSGKRIPPRTLGHTVLKYRLLKKQGWAVVRVPYYEFDKIPFWASMERQRYLQRLLKTHESISFSKVDVSAHTPPVPNRRSRFD